MNQNHGKSSKSSIVIIILLLLVIIGESLYIYFDKFANQEEPGSFEKPIKELVKFDEAQFTENPSENDYYNILKYENSDLEIVFKLFTKESNDEIAIKADMFIQDAKVETLHIDTYFKCDDEESVECPNGGEKFDDKKSGAIRAIRESIGTIKGDRYYLYMIFDKITNSSNSSIYIMKADGGFLESKIQFFGRNEYETYLACDNNCKMASRLNAADGMYVGNYAIADDAIYYFKLSKYEKGETEDKVFANVYKLTINSDKVSNEKLETCMVKVLDLRLDTDLYNFKYEDM